MLWPRSKNAKLFPVNLLAVSLLVYLLVDQRPSLAASGRITVKRDASEAEAETKSSNEKPLATGVESGDGSTSPKPAADQSSGSQVEPAEGASEGGSRARTLLGGNCSGEFLKH